MLNWEEELHNLWGDLVQPAEPFQIFETHPHPMGNDLHGPQLLLVQGRGPFSALSLMAKYHGHPHVVSSFAHTTGYDLLRLIGAGRACEDVDCRLYHGPRDIPLALHSDFVSGMHIVVDVPAHDCSQSDIASFLAAAPRPWADDDDSVPLLDRQGVARALDEDSDPETTDTSMSDSEESDTIWHRSAIYSVALDLASGHTDWSDYDSLKSSTADLLHPDAYDLVAVHHVSATPQDHAEYHEAVFIAEMPEDLGNRLRLILVDVMLYQNRPDFRGDHLLRMVKAVQPSISRQDLLASLGVAAYCDELWRLAHHPACLVWLNFDIVPFQDHAALALQHGDFLQVALPPASVLPQDFPVRLAAAVCDSGTPLAHLHQQLADGIQPNQSLAENIPRPEEPIQEDSDFDSLFQTHSAHAPENAILAVVEAETSGDTGATSSRTPPAPSWLQEIADLWLQHRQQNATASSSDCWPFLASWYLDHIRYPRTTEMRSLELRPTTGTWLDDLAQLWHDFLDLAEPFQVFVVRPPPFAAAAGPLAHLLLVQRPQPHLASTLVAIVDDNIDPWSSDIVALAVPRILRSAELIANTGYAAVHYANPPVQICTTESPRGVFTDLHPADVADGDSLLLSVANIPVDPLDAADDIVLLQTQLTKLIRSVATSLSSPTCSSSTPCRSSIELAAAIPAPISTPSSTVDCTDAFQTLCTLDEVFVVPSFFIEELHNWHPAAPWLCSWWDGASTFDSLVIYFDGSFKPGSPSLAGFGVVAFVRVHGEWYFAGYHAAPLGSSATSYLAEQIAGATALKLAYDLLSICSATASELVHVTLVYDSLTVGQQAQGRWASIQSPSVGTLLRGLHRLCEQRFQCVIAFEHVRSHTGDPGNELADYLADAAAHDWLPVDASLHRWLGLLETQQFCAGIEWAWILFAPEYTALWHGSQLRFPATTLPSQPPVLRVPFERQEPIGLVPCRFKVCTYNVLSATGAQHDGLGLSGPSKLSLVLRQLAALDIHIFALQETRLRNPPSADLEGYWLFHSPAEPHGHFGITVGFSKQLPFADSHQQVFKKQDIRIILATPRALVLHVLNSSLDFVLYALHAPHSGSSYDDLVLWWDSIANAVPPRLRDRPAMLLADANASVGACPSPNVGGHQAGPEEVKAGPFLDFLACRDIFLPARSTIGSSVLVRPGLTLPVASAGSIMWGFLCIGEPALVPHGSKTILRMVLAMTTIFRLAQKFPSSVPGEIVSEMCRLVLPNKCSSLRSTLMLLSTLSRYLGILMFTRMPIAFNDTSWTL